MGRLFDDYIKTITNIGTQKTLKSAYKHIGDYEDSNKTLDDVKRIFYASKVDTPQSVRNFRSQFRNYANYIEDPVLMDMLDCIDALEICTKVKELGVAKYFSHTAFQKAFEAINNSAVLNPFYVQTLFLCIYEGVYSRDFSVLVNLKASDISGNTVICQKDDGSYYQVEISSELSARLLTLGNQHSWKCRNRYNEFDREISGETYDSCFKVEKRERANRRSSPKTVYENTYRRLLREIISTELGYNIAAFEIYISGIMYRISLALQAQGIGVIDAFTKNNRDPVVKQIIEKELTRSHYDKPISQFKQLVEGHIEVFVLPFEHDVNTSTSFVCPDSQRLDAEAIQDYITYKGIVYESSDLMPIVTIGVPQPKKDMVEISGRRVYPREKSIAQFALRMADYKCEVDNEHPSFISKSRSLPYTEPHHLIPLAYAECFDVSLDVPENIVALCSNCHNQIHYGSEIKTMLRWLYESRKSKLEQVGLKISFEKLLWMYNVD